MNDVSQHLRKCRACGGRLSLTFCDLGTMAVANAYLSKEADLMAEPVYPLRVKVCEHCKLVQLDTVVDAASIFSEYAYYSSASATWLAHAAQFSQAMTERLLLNQDSLVVEVASNDGYLLRNFVQAGIPCQGIEPAANIAAQAIANGIPTEVVFLNVDTARALVEKRGRHADLVVANNVLAHVPDINGFVAGLATLAGAHGVVSIEAPHLVRLVEGIQFDTIYHEHYAYWSLLAMENVLNRHGLHVFDLEQLPTHGGSLRVLAKADPLVHASEALTAVREMESQLGLQGEAYYQGFDQRVQAVLSHFRTWLGQQRYRGHRMAAYGAAAKGNTFLNAAGVSNATFLAVADKSPGKQGRLLPGSHIPVLTPEAMLTLVPDDILVLPWNIADEIVNELRQSGFKGRIWTATPDMRLH